MLTLELLKRSNAILKSRHGKKHRAIKASEIESVYSRPSLLSVMADAKTRKGLSMGYLTGILYLAPASLSGFNVCPKSSEGCRAACLYTAGRGRFYSTERARTVKTLAYFSNRERFNYRLRISIEALERKALRLGLKPAVRLNGTSDIVWEGTGIFQAFPRVQFYDYTKIVKRFERPLPTNYSLTFSASESNQGQISAVKSHGGNTAIVFRGDLPATYLGMPVINGDANDLRFLDPPDCIVGLKAKGKAKKDASGFVRD